MNRFSKLILAIALFPLSALAYPPAPHHMFYGIVRDEYGTPIQTDTAEVFLETSAGVTVSTKIQPNLNPGINYRLQIPMDAGLTSDLYLPTALRPAMPFKIKVKIGQTTYLPIEMSGDFSKLGQPGQRTLLNLTLGVDSDGDGLPDAWERALIARIGGGRTLSDINPNQDSDGDGMSNMDEYLAGTYAFDPKDGFTLKIVSFHDVSPMVEFTAVSGRTYSIYGSSDLKTWESLEFRIPVNGSDADFVSRYQASDVSVLQVEVKTPAEGVELKFFKLMVQ